MASVITRPIIRPLQARMFSAVAQPNAVSADVQYNVKKLDNGLTVASVDAPVPVPRLAVVAKAGSRYESADELGISHLLRKAACLKTAYKSTVGIVKSTESLGSDITCEGNREYVLYKSSVNRDHVPEMVEILKDITTNQSFRRWEVDDLSADQNALKLDLQVLGKQPHVGCVEGLHEAAFGQLGLGRSLYMPAFNVGRLVHSDLQDYCERNFSKGRVALVGLGVSSAEMEALGSEFSLHEPQSPVTGAAVYHGGECIHNTGGNLSFAAVAFEGPSAGAKNLLASEVLKQVLANEPAIKYSHSRGALNKAASNASTAPHSISSLTAYYSDSGLFGFMAVAPSTDITEVLKAAGGQLREVLSNPVSEADFAKAKLQLKASMCMQTENPDQMLNWVGEQAVSGDKLLTPYDVLKMLDDVTVADVNAAAKTIASSKPSLSATGNTALIPYVDQIV